MQRGTSENGLVARQPVFWLNKYHRQRSANRWCPWHTRCYANRTQKDLVTYTVNLIVSTVRSFVPPVFSKYAETVSPVRSVRFAIAVAPSNHRALAVLSLALGGTQRPEIRIPLSVRSVGVGGLN